MDKSVFKRTLLSAGLLLLTFFAHAQKATTSTVDETMRSHDKIYVVMTVCIVILVVFFLYLIRIDSKISRKEKSE